MRTRAITLIVLIAGCGRHGFEPVEAQVSPNGGGSWTTLRTYTTADVFDTELISLTASAAANTQIRFIATAAGDRHLRVDDVEIAFTRP